MVANFETNPPSPVRYVAESTHSIEAAREAAKSQGISIVHWLTQRKSQLGWIGEQTRPLLPNIEVAADAWRAAQPILLPEFVASDIPAHAQDIAESKALMQALLDGADCGELLQMEPYAGRLDPRFELLSSTFDEGDPQEIIKLEFDAIENSKTIAENIWVKLSWLSYAEYDGSFRFRFSFGMENYEDVAADPERQIHAALLAEAIFPESAIISANSRLLTFLKTLLQCGELMYVERIIYFNAPEGGAQFHHDVERGHLGVVFAQVSGSTAWLALSTGQLLDALQDFLTAPDAEKSMAATIKSKKSRATLIKLASDRSELAEFLNRRDNDPIEQLINRTPTFTRYLIDRGHAYILHPGDAILLPQHDAAHCSWHAVYCLDDEPGEALSFAIRHVEE